MNKIISDYYKEVPIITPRDGYHFFFAYYDMRATGERGKHLCHRVAFMDRLPTARSLCCRLTGRIFELGRF